MRHALLLVTLMVATFCCVAQPVLTWDKATPRPGDSYYYYITAGGAEGPAGASQTWNFAGISSSNSYRGDYKICSASPQCPSFPGSILSLTTPGATYFMGANGDSLWQTGAWYDRSVDIEEKYTDPQASLRYPLTYGDSWVDSFRSVQILGNDTLTRSGSDSTIADAWGTLLIKFGSVPGVLRLKRVLTMEERIDTGGTPIIYHTKATGYYWYQPGYHEYLLYTMNIRTDNPYAPAQRNEGRYTGMVNGGLGVEPQSGPLFSIENPASATLNVSITPKGTEALHWGITDIQGRLLMDSKASISPEHTALRIPIESLSPGVYLLSVRQGARKDTHRFTVL